MFEKQTLQCQLYMIQFGITSKKPNPPLSISLLPQHSQSNEALLKCSASLLFFFTSLPLLLFFTLGYYFGRFNMICSLSFVKDMNVKKRKKRKPLYFILNIWHFCFTFIMINNGSLLLKIKKKTYQIYKDSKETVYSFQNVLKIYKRITMCWVLWGVQMGILCCFPYCLLLYYINKRYINS